MSRAVLQPQAIAVIALNEFQTHRESANPRFNSRLSPQQLLPLFRAKNQEAAITGLSPSKHRGHITERFGASANEHVFCINQIRVDAADLMLDHNVAVVLKNPFRGYLTVPEAYDDDMYPGNVARL